MYKINSEEEFKDALNEVFKFDNAILIEAFVKGRELECSVMGNDNPIASMPAEIVVNDQYEFYTYEAKYLDPDAVVLNIPAVLDNAIAEKARELSLKAYKALHCEDFARVDLFLADDGSIFINEINTIPGFTNSSMFPMMWQERGISFTDLLNKLIDMAFTRNQLDQRIVKTYNPEVD